MGFTNILENALLDTVFGASNYNAPIDLQIGLSLAAPAQDGSGILEPDDATTGYARVVIPNTTNDGTSGTWLAAQTDTDSASPSFEKGVKVAAIDIEFPTATGDWGNITHFFISNGSDVLGYGELTPARTINTGDTARFKAGELTITLD